MTLPPGLTLWLRRDEAWELTMLRSIRDDYLSGRGGALMAAWIAPDGGLVAEHGRLNLSLTHARLLIASLIATEGLPSAD